MARCCGDRSTMKRRMVRAVNITSHTSLLAPVMQAPFLGRIQSVENTDTPLVKWGLTGLVGDLDQIAAGVVEHGRGHRPHIRGFLGEAHSQPAQSLELRLDVVDGE